MKELYTAPNAELLCLAPTERIANEIVWEELVLQGGGMVSQDANVDMENDMGDFPGFN